MGITSSKAEKGKLWLELWEGWRSQEQTGRRRAPSPQGSLSEQAEGNAESCPHIKQPGDQGWGWGMALCFHHEVKDLSSGGEGRRFRTQPQLHNV